MSPLPSGTKLGPYEVLAPLGAGGMGEVYRGLDSRLGREVALKVIHHESSRDGERIRRFEQEARAAGALSHPNVCAVYDLGSHDGAPYVVMELLEGETLRAVLADGPLPIRRAIAYAAQAAEGLAAAHAKGIVHRDLKPENLFVMKDGRVKVLDFGLAKLASGVPAKSVPSGAGMGTITTPGTLLGTTGYMAPEQIRGAESADGRVDVFALGVVLFEMLTGRRPFDGLTAADIMNAVLNQEAPALATLRADTPAQVAWLVKRCLAKDPARRVQTILDVRNDLEEILRDLDSGALAAPGAKRSTSEPTVRRFEIGATHVRSLSDRNPRLIGYPMYFLDNRRESDTLVVFLHGLGGDFTRFEGAMRHLPYRAVALTLAGFAPDDTFRPVLAFDDHCELIRALLVSIAREVRPTRTVLVGFSAGCDMFLRMLVSPKGLGITAEGYVALGVNVSLRTCFVSRLVANMDLRDPAGVLARLKALGAETQSLAEWLTLQGYLARTFLKFKSDFEALRRNAADIVEPFQNDGDPLPAWYRAAMDQFASVRFVFSDVEVGPAESVLARHLESNVLGDRFTEKSFAMEKDIGHSQLPDAGLANRYIEAVVAELKAMGK